MVLDKYEGNSHVQVYKFHKRDTRQEELEDDNQIDQTLWKARIHNSDPHLDETSEGRSSRA